MKVLILGNIDRNIGDDLMIKSVIEILQPYGDVEILLPSVDPEKIKVFKAYTHVNAISLEYTSIKGICYILKNVKMVVYVAGSIFQLYNIRITLHYLKLLLIFLLFKVSGIKLILLGCNVGPIGPRIGFLITGLIFRVSDLATVRDSYSFNSMKRYKNKNLFYYPDIVYSMGVLKYFREESTFHDQIMLGVSCYNFKRDPLLNYKLQKQLAQVIDFIIEKYKGHVVIFAFSTGSEEDQKAAQIIEDLCTNKKYIEFCYYNGDINKFLSLISMCNRFITIRFHALVIASYFNIPILPIAYSKKVESFLEDIGFEEYYTVADFVNCDPLETAEKLAAARDLFVMNGIEFLVEKSLGHLKQFEKFLNNYLHTGKVS